MSDTITITLPRLRLRRSIVAPVACLVAGALVATGVLALTQAFSDSGVSAPSVLHARGFAVTVPVGWKADRAAAPALAVLRARDGSGTVVVQASPAPQGDAKTVTKQLTAELARRFRPFTPLGARFVTTRSGTAYLYTFSRGASVETIVLASASGRSYTIDAVIANGATAAAQQAGAIIASFGG